MRKTGRKKDKENVMDKNKGSENIIQKICKEFQYEENLLVRKFMCLPCKRYTKNIAEILKERKLLRVISKWKWLNQMHQTISIILSLDQQTYLYSPLSFSTWE